LVLLLLLTLSLSPPFKTGRQSREGIDCQAQVVTELLLLRSRAALPINYAVVVPVPSAEAPGFRKLLLPFFLCSTAVEKKSTLGLNMPLLSLAGKEQSVKVGNRVLETVVVVADVVLRVPSKLRQ
jgi:hypothetical protein